jgi:hypothetical protein
MVLTTNVGGVVRAEILSAVTTAAMHSAKTASDAT